MSNDRYKEIRDVLAECRDIAMEWTLRGRIPECGKFGEIAQDLDYLCEQLGEREMTDMTVERAMQLADLLYSAGYDARHKERDYDPRGCDAWQDVVEALTATSVDAERYRALRDALLDDESEAWEAFIQQPEPKNAADFDAAIDAAR